MWVPVLVVLAGACGGGDGTAEEPSASTAPQEQASAAPQAPSTETTDDDAAGPRVYVVQSGDTLSEIARRFDTTVEAIVRANDISDPDVIDVGQELEIPGG